jgi:hypothetical protein
MGADTVVLRGEAVRRVHAAMEMALRSAAPRRNGLALPPDVEWDLAVLRAAADVVRGFAASRDQVSQSSEVAALSHDGDEQVSAAEVAAVLDVSVQYARVLCRRSFKTARRVGREWRVSAGELAKVAAERDAGEDEGR